MMGSTFTKVWSSLLGWIKNIFFWIILFFGAIILLFWNEWKQDVSMIAQQALPLQISEIDSQHQGQFVAARGILQTSDMLTDNLYLHPWKYLIIQRTVETFARKETAKSSTASWTQQATTTYEYTKDRTSSPMNSTEFFQASGHTNPELYITSEKFLASDTRIWNYALNLNILDIPALENLALSTWNTELTKNMSWQAARFYQWSYIYLWSGSFENPLVWDIRISYKVLPAEKAITVFGTIDGSMIAPYIYNKDSSLYRAFFTNPEWAIAIMSKEHTTSLWMFRIWGCILLRIWLQLMISLLHTIVSFIPFASKFTKSLTFVITWILALSIWLITILIAKVIHSRLALGIIILITWCYFARAWYTNTSLPWGRTLKQTQPTPPSAS